MHSAKCDVVIPGEEQLSSIPYREFVAFRESAVYIFVRFSSSTDLVVKLFHPPPPHCQIPLFLSSQFTSVVGFRIPTFAGRAINSLSL